MTVEQWYAKGKQISIGSSHVFCKREGTGKTLVCIHGFPSSSFDFHAVWPGLVAHFDVMVTDLIGLGKSSKPNRPLSIAYQADILESVLQDQAIKEAHLLSHDIGNTVAQELIARVGNGKSKIKWKSCSFLNGGLFPEAHKPLFIQKLLISPLGFFVVNLMSESSFKKTMTQVFSESHPPNEEFLISTWNLIKANQGLRMIPRLIRYMQERVQQRERWVTPLIDKTIPHQLINGIEDPVSGLQLVERYKELVPEAKIVPIDNSGHYPHIETPNEVVKAVLKFSIGIV